MSVNNKRTLSTVVYYTLAALALISAGFFLYCLLNREVVMWAEIIYYIWIALVVGAVIFDVICTSTGEGKQTSGLIIYILSLLSVIVAGILYFMNSGAGGLATEFFNIFLSVSLISLMTSGYMIATWCVGESLVEHKTAQREIEKR